MKEKESRLCHSALGRHVAKAYGTAKDDYKNVIGFGRILWSQRNTRALSGQGTTEYAILVGVLVVIAILAITVFRPKIQELWDAISSGINGL